MTPTSALVSIIVPSYNSGATIDRCLGSLLAQESDHSFEVIVVDSSDDGTAERIRSGFPTVRLVHLPERTLPGKARNIAIREATGRILALTDADCVAEPGWLRRMVQRHDTQDCAVVGGSVTNGLPENPVAWCGCLVEFNEFLPSAPERFVTLLPTCNVSFKAEVFARHGHFPEDLWPSEDHIFSWRLVQSGERLLFDPQIRVQHLFRPTFRAFVRHQRRLGAASAAARRRVNLPHDWLIGHPLRWLVPLFRWGRIEARLAHRDLPNFLRFNLYLPLCMCGLIAWGIGFCRGDGDAPANPAR